MIETLVFAAFVGLFAVPLAVAFWSDDLAALRRAAAALRAWRADRAAFRAGDGLHEWLVDLGRQVAAERRWEQYFMPLPVKVERARRLRRAGFGPTLVGRIARLP